PNDRKEDDAQHECMAFAKTFPTQSSTKGPTMTAGTLPMPKSKTTLLPANLDEGIRVDIITVTPELAARWLKRNHANRKVRARHVSRLVRAMRAGEWDDLNGDTIRFSDNHELLDGQHRLLACIEAQQAFTTLVVFGIVAHK